MANEGSPIKEVNNTQDIDNLENDIPPTAPLFSNLATRGPASPSPTEDLLTPPSDASTSTTKAKPLTLNLLAKDSDVPHITNTPASTPSPTELPHPPKAQSPSTLTIPKQLNSPDRKVAKAVPPWLKAAYRKFGQNIAVVDKDATFQVKALNVTKKKISPTASPVVPNSTPVNPLSPITGSVMLDIDQLLRLSPTPQFSGLEEFLTPQDALIIGMASVPGSKDVDMEDVDLSFTPKTPTKGSGISSSGEDSSTRKPSLGAGTKAPAPPASTSPPPASLEASWAVPSIPPEIRAELLRDAGESGNSLTSDPNETGGAGIKLPDDERLEEEWADVAVGGNKKKGEGEGGGGVGAGDDGTDPMDGAAGAGGDANKPGTLGVGSLKIKPKKARELPKAIIDFRRWSQDPINATDPNVQAALAAVDAALDITLGPSRDLVEKNLKLRNLIESQAKVIKDGKQHLERQKAELKKAYEEKAMIWAELEEAKKEKGGLISEDECTKRNAEKIKFLEDRIGKQDKTIQDAKDKAKRDKAVNYEWDKKQAERIEKQAEEIDKLTQQSLESIDEVARKEVERLKGEIQTQQQLNSAFNSQSRKNADAAFAKEESLNKEIVKLKSDLITQPGEADYAIANDQNEKLNQKVEELEEKCDGYEKQIYGMKIKAKELEKKLSDREEDLGNRRLMTIEECAEQNVTTNQQLRDKIERLEEQAKDKSKRDGLISLEDCTTQNAASNSKKENQIERLQKDLEILKKENEKLKKRRNKNKDDKEPKVEGDSDSEMDHLLDQSSGDEDPGVGEFKEDDDASKKTISELEDPTMISATQCDIEKEHIKNTFKYDIEVLRQRVKDLVKNPLAGSLTEEQCAEKNKEKINELQKILRARNAGILRLENNIRLLQEKCRRVRADLIKCQGHKQTGNKDEKKEVKEQGKVEDKRKLTEQVTDLGKQVRESNREVAAQAKQLQAKGIVTEQQQFARLERQNASLRNQVTNLTARLGNAGANDAGGSGVGENGEGAGLEWLVAKIAELRGVIEDQNKSINDLNARQLSADQINQSIWDAERNWKKQMKKEQDEKKKKIEKEKKAKGKSEERKERDKERKMKAQKTQEEREAKQEAKDAVEAAKAASLEAKKDIQRVKDREQLRKIVKAREADAKKAENGNRFDASQLVGNSDGAGTARAFARQGVINQIWMVNNELVTLKAKRALDGLQEADAAGAVNEAKRAIKLAEGFKDADLIAQAHLWAAVAHFYHEDGPSAESSLEDANELAAKLKKEEDKVILKFWNEHQMDGSSVEKRMEGYYKGTEQARRDAKRGQGKRRRPAGSSSSTTSSSPKRKFKRDRKDSPK